MTPVTHTWRGFNANWNDSVNWTGGLPANGADLVFPSVDPLDASRSPVRVTTNNLLTNVESLSFTGTSAGYNLGGNSLTVGAGGIADTMSVLAGSNTVSLNLTLGAAQTFSDAAGSAASALLIAGQVGGIAANTLSIAGPGTVILAAANTYVGQTNINSGTLVIRNVAALGTTAGKTVIGDGAGTPDATLQIDLAAAGTIAETFDMRGANPFPDPPGAVLQLVGSSNATLSGNVTFVDPSRGNTIQVDTNLVLTLAGTLSDTGGGARILFKQGSGKLVMPTDNSVFLSDTRVLDGVLNIQHPNALGNTLNAVTVSSGASLELEGNFPVPVLVSLQLAGTGSAGVGALRNIGPGQNSIAGPVSLNTAVTRINVDTLAGKLTLSAQVTGVGGLEKAGPGQLILDNAANNNNYTGLTTVAGGILTVKRTNDLGAAGVLQGTTVNTGASLQFDGVGGTIAERLVFDGGAFATGATGSLQNVAGNTTVSGIVTLNGTTTMATDVAGDRLTLGDIVSGAGGLTKVGPGFLRFSGANDNNYGGTTTVNAGTLELNKTQPALPFSPFIAVPGNLVIGQAFGPTASVVFLDAGGPGGGRDQIAATALVTIFNTAAAVELDLNGFNQTLAGLFMSGGTIDLDGGTLTLTGNVTADGFAVIEDGTLSLGGSTRTFTVGDTSAPALLISAIISDGGASAGVVKAGAGELRLSGANTYTGTTAVNAGLLGVNNATALGAATGAASNGTTVTAGATLVVDGVGVGNEALSLNGFGIAVTPPFGALVGFGAASWAGNITLASDSSVGALSGGDTLTLTGAIGQTGGTRALTKVGEGTVQFFGASPNTYTGLTTVANGRLDLQKQVAIFPFPPLTAILGPLTIGDGAGATNSAEVRLLNSNQIATDQPVTILGDGNLNLNGNSQTIASLTMTGGNVTTAAGTLTLGGDVVTNASGNTAGISGNLSLGAGTRTFNVADGAAAIDLDISAVISSGAVVKTGPGTLRYSGAAANIYAGGTNVNQGTLLLQKTAGVNAIPAAGTFTIGDGVGAPQSDVVRLGNDNQIADGAAVVINSSGLLDLNGRSDVIGALTLVGGQVNTDGPPGAFADGRLGMNGNVTVNASTQTAVIASGTFAAASPRLDLRGAARTFTVASGANLVISAIIGDTLLGGGLIKAGVGTATVTGNNLYLGTTTINSGTLVVNGAQSSSAVIVNSGGTLGGSGTTGPVTVNAGGTLSPGATPGILSTVGDVAFVATSTYRVEIQGLVPGTGYDQLNVTGNANLGGATLTIATFTTVAPSGTTFIIVAATGSRSGTFAGLPDNTTFTGPNNQRFRINYGSNNVTLTTVGTSTPILVTGANAGSLPEVRVFNATTDAQILSFLAYDASFRGGVRVAVGDVTGDGFPDIVTGAGAGGGPHVRVFDGRTGAQVPGAIGSFFAYVGSFTGGVFVAAGDINGDGRADVITGAGAGGGPHVRVFDGATGALIRDFFAYTSTFRGGVSVAAGDVNGDGTVDIITGAGAGGGPHVRVFTGVGLTLVRDFFAYSGNFLGGVFVSAGDIDGDGRADIITGAGAGGGPHVKAFNGLTGAEIASFFAYESNFLGGVRVAALDFDGNGTADFVTAPGTGRSWEARIFDGLSRTLLDAFFALNTDFIATGRFN